MNSNGTNVGVAVSDQNLLSVYDEHGNVKPMKLSKVTQFATPSHPLILAYIERASNRMAKKTTFNGRTITKSIFVNCLLLGLDALGEDLEQRVYNAGADLLRAGERAGEIETPVHEIRSQIHLDKMGSKGT